MSQLKTSRKRLIAVGIAAALVIGGGGAAFAYWSSSGTGAGSASTGTSDAFTVTSTAPVGDPLVPGGEPQVVTFTVANPSDAALVLSSVVVTVANPDGTAWVSAPGCSAADYVLGTPVIDYGPVAGTSSIDGTASVAMIDTGVNQDACKTVTVPLYFAAS